MTDSVRLVKTEYASDLCAPRQACQLSSGDLAEGWRRGKSNPVWMAFIRHS